MLHSFSILKIVEHPFLLGSVQWCLFGAIRPIHATFLASNSERLSSVKRLLRWFEWWEADLMKCPKWSEDIEVCWLLTQMRERFTKKSSKISHIWMIYYWSVRVGSPDGFLWGLLILRYRDIRSPIWRLQFNFKSWNEMTDDNVQIRSPVWFNSPWVEERYIWGWCSAFCWNPKLVLSMISLPSLK